MRRQPSIVGLLLLSLRFLLPAFTLSSSPPLHVQHIHPGCERSENEAQTELQSSYTSCNGSDLSLDDVVPDCTRLLQVNCTQGWLEVNSSHAQKLLGLLSPSLSPSLSPLFPPILPLSTFCLPSPFSSLSPPSFPPPFVLTSSSPFFTPPPPFFLLFLSLGSNIGSAYWQQVSKVSAYGSYSEMRHFECSLLGQRLGFRTSV